MEKYNLEELKKENIGHSLKIINLKDEPNMSHYAGKTGQITDVGIDPWGEPYLVGTWGGIHIYLNWDQVEFLD